MHLIPAAVFIDVINEHIQLGKNLHFLCISGPFHFSLSLSVYLSILDVGSNKLRNIYIFFPPICRAQTHFIDSIKKRKINKDGIVRGLVKNPQKCPLDQKLNKRRLEIATVLFYRKIKLARSYFERMFAFSFVVFCRW